MNTVIASGLRVVKVWEETGMNALRSVFPELGAAIDELDRVIADAVVPDGDPTMLVGRARRVIRRDHLS